MAVDCLSTQALESVAIMHGFALAVDPFHGSIAYEFQKRTGKGTRCAGCIIGPEATTLYTRSIRGHQTEDYEEVKTVPNADMDVEIFSKFASDSLG